MGFRVRPETTVCKGLTVKTVFKPHVRLSTSVKLFVILELSDYLIF